MAHSESTGAASRQQGITGLETAIILIAFVVVASVFAFTVLSTGIFASERSAETVFGGLESAQSSLEPRGRLVAYNAKVDGGTSTVFKISFIVSSALNGEPVDLTPAFTANDSGTDPDAAASNEQITVISYTDAVQELPDVPWTVSFLGDDDGDFLLENNETAEITVWLLNQNNAVGLGTNDAATYMSADGMTSSHTVLGTNDEFTVQVKPSRGAVVSLKRKLPSQLDTVMNLN